MGHQCHSTHLSKHTARIQCGQDTIRILLHISVCFGYLRSRGGRLIVKAVENFLGVPPTQATSAVAQG